MKKYRIVIFDADDTLVDYRADSLRAFRIALESTGHGSEETLRACVEFDYGNWEKVGLSAVHLEHIQKGYHALYRDHVRDIFAHAEACTGEYGWADAAEKAWMCAFAEPGQPVAGAWETVAALKKKYRVYAATNGLACLQHGRLSAFPLDGVFVSEELGAIKPSAAFFDAMLARLGTPPASCLFVGDSLRSDIAGATAAGMDCIWYNPACAPCPDGVDSVTDLKELIKRL